MPGKNSDPGAADLDEVLAELGAFLRIPSVSTLAAHAEDVQRAAQWVADYLTGAGLDHTQIIPTAGHPLVYADWLHAPGQPTLLIYGHYDVQPPDPLEAWHSPPFEPTVRNGNLYARGSADDKGQLYVHLKAVERLLRARGALPINIRFLIEGEEEIGSPAIAGYVAAHADALRADAALISDSPMFADGQPALTLGLRGSVNAIVTVQTVRQDLHSGLHGGAAPNAIHALNHIIAGLTDRQGRVQIPGYYEAVRPLSALEREQWAALPFDEADYRREIGADTLIGEADYSILERQWARPTLDVTGFAGGFTGDGFKTIIPARAQAALSLRLVPDQEPDVVAAALERAIQALCPPWATVALQSAGDAAPVLVEPTEPVLEVAAAALAEAFGTAPVGMRMGGSIPIVSLFSTALHAPCVLMDLGLPDDNLHAPNEKMKLDNIMRGITASAGFMRRLRR
jgi:acetylornithine deacetylase/succinyl-diaminopimelate desuccinylase-like protein